MKPISSTVCRVVASKLRGLLLLQWSSTLNLIHANLFVHATAQPLPASRAANGLRRQPRRRRLYLQLTVARPAQMLMLVSAQEQLMPITTLSALTTLQSTATTFIIKKVATVRGVRWRWRRPCIMGRGSFWIDTVQDFLIKLGIKPLRKFKLDHKILDGIYFWTGNFEHSYFHKISLKNMNCTHAATMNIHKKPSYKHSGLQAPGLHWIF